MTKTKIRSKTQTRHVQPWDNDKLMLQSADTRIICVLYLFITTTNQVSF